MIYIKNSLLLYPSYIYFFHLSPLMLCLSLSPLDIFITIDFIYYYHYY